MRNKDIEDIAGGWLIGDIISEATSSNNSSRGSDAGSFLFWLFVGFILFSIYAVSGIEFDTLWAFLKIITFPVTWDYQLLQFQFMGPNNYISTIVSILVIFLIYQGLNGLDLFRTKVIEDKVLNRQIGRFQPIRTTAGIASFLYNSVIVHLCALYVIVLVFKIMGHGFLSILTFIFSI